LQIVATHCSLCAVEVVLA